MLLDSTTRIGILMAAGEAVAVAPAPVAALTEGVMKAMLLTKLKGMAMTVVVGSAILATVVGVGRPMRLGPVTPRRDRAKAASALRNQRGTRTRTASRSWSGSVTSCLDRPRQLEDRLTELGDKEGEKGAAARGRPRGASAWG